MNQNNDDELIRKNVRTGLIVFLVVAFMVGLSFASVPLYTLFCRITGFEGTTQVSEALPDKILERRITVKFNADTGRNMGWEFKPEQREISVRVGERGLTAFFAHNKLDKVTGGTAIYNVTPLKAGKYFHKVQCFCFNEQFLKPQESVSMPVLFFIDPSIAEDRNMDDVETITLSYTFYPAESQELDEALEAFYNSGDKVN